MPLRFRFSFAVVYFIGRVLSLAVVCICIGCGGWLGSEFCF
jgi:hypothetical protein